MGPHRTSYNPWTQCSQHCATLHSFKKTLYHATSNIFVSALPGKTGKHENHIFHSIGLFYTHNAPVRCLPERKKMSSVMCLIASNVCWDSTIFHKYDTKLSIDFYSRFDEQQLPPFTQRLTPWQTWLIQTIGREFVTSAKNSRILTNFPKLKKS